MNRSFAAMATMFMGAMLVGCGSDPTGPAPLVAQQTYSSSADVRRGPMQDRSGALMDENARVNDPVSRRVPTGALNTPAEPAPVHGVSDAVKNNVRAPSDVAAEQAGLGTNASTLPAPRVTTSTGGAGGVGTGGVGTGNYLILGSIVVEVNGTPISAGRVLDSISPVLAAKARDLDASRFRAVAAKEIGDQLRKLIMDELEYAIAEHSLDAQDKRLAEAMTMFDRQEAIRKAGGSLQLARMAAQALGRDFDDDVIREQARVNYVRVYYQKYELPRVQITADDIRRYYQRHQKDLFTEQSAAQFRLIKIDFKRTGSRDKAMDKAKDIEQRLSRGDDFATLAGEMNDDPFLLKNKGDVSGNGGNGAGAWLDRGTFKEQKVEDAVFALNVGEVSSIIETADACYIAKLEQKKQGRQRSFDEEAVQAKIRENLTSEQIAILRQRAQERLVKNAVIEPENPNIIPVVEMAMQRYREWSGKN